MKTLWLVFLFVAAVPMAFASSFYIIREGSATQRNPWDKEPTLIGLRHVTIIGAVARPGVYFFADSISLAKIIDLTRTDISAAGERPHLERVGLTITNGTGVSDSVVINVRKLLVSDKRDTLWILEGGEVIFIPAMMGL